MIWLEAKYVSWMFYKGQERKNWHKYEPYSYGQEKSRMGDLRAVWIKILTYAKMDLVGEFSVCNSKEVFNLWERLQCR